MKMLFFKTVEQAIPEMLSTGEQHIYLVTEFGGIVGVVSQGI